MSEAFESDEPRCWWCGAVADSREHRFKASQLRKLFVDEDHLMLGGRLGDRGTRINGVGSRVMLFPKVLCASCNNARSQPFDEAYDHFVQRVWDDPEYFRARSEFEMDDIFHADPDGSRKLARYYLKNIGCRIAELGFDVPQPLIDFMDGIEFIEGGGILLYKDFTNYDQFRRAGGSGHYPYANRGYNPVSPDDGPLEAFCAEIQDGPVGAFFHWQVKKPLGPVFCAQSRTFLRDRTEMPNPELHEDEWRRALIMKIAQDNRGVTPFP